MAVPNRSIRLSQPSQVVEAEDVYFAFGAGRLSYDCVTCNAKCCRGWGYLTTAGKELGRQLELRPSLPLFVEPTKESNPQHYTIGNCAPGCFFLSKGLCEIHARYGYDAKPETCRLFPFNNLRRIGRYLVVRPHPNLCPLEVVPPGSASDCSSYPALLEAMSRQGISAPVPECSIDELGAEHVIAVERKIVDLAERSLQHDNYLDFVRQQLLLLDVHAPSVETTLQLVAELTGIPANVTTGRDVEVVRTMTAITPFLRSQLVFRDVSPDRPQDRLPLDYGRVPSAMLCIYLFAEAARASGMQNVTFQTLSKLAHDFDALIRLLVYSDAVMVWQRGVSINVNAFEPPEFRTAFLKLAKSLLPDLQRKRRARLGDLLAGHLPADRLQRVLFLKQAATYFAGRLVSLDREPTTGRKVGARDHLVNAVRRWTLANVHEEVLVAAYSRTNARLSLTTD